MNPEHLLKLVKELLNGLWFEYGVTHFFTATTLTPFIALPIHSR